MNKKVTLLLSMLLVLSMIFPILTKAVLAEGSEVYGTVIDSYQDPAYGRDFVYTGYNPSIESYSWTWTDPNPEPGAGDSLDLHWVNPVGLNSYVIWDMGAYVAGVRVYPTQDHPPFPEEYHEFDVYVSNDLVTWTGPLECTAFYEDGYAPDPSIADDGVKDYDFGGDYYRYVKICPNGSDQQCDCEIDAVEALAPIFPGAIPGSISGIKFFDANQNGEFDEGDWPLEGWTIFLDLNENGELDNGEPYTTTNEEGYYEFTGLEAGTYIVREVLQPGWTCTTGEKQIVTLVGETTGETGVLSGSVSVPLIAGQHIEVGFVAISFDGDYLYVAFRTTDGYYLNETHLYVNFTAPTTSAPGLFPFKNESLPDGTQTDEYTISLDNLTLTEWPEIIYIAAHATVYCESWPDNGGAGTETAWANPPGWTQFDGGWGGYFQYATTILAVESVTDVNFGNWHPMAYGPAGLTIGFWKTNIGKNLGYIKGKPQLDEETIAGYLSSICGAYGMDYPFLLNATFEDDFERNDLGDAWEIVDGDWVIEDGELSGNSTSGTGPNYGTAKLKIRTAEDGFDYARVLEAEVTFMGWNTAESTEWQRVGIILQKDPDFDYDPQPGKNDWCLIFRGNDRLYLLNEYTAWGPSIPFTPVEGTTYHMKMAWDGTTIYGKAWAVGESEPDWQLTVSWTNIVEEPCIGLYCSYAHAHFDNVVVYELCSLNMEKAYEILSIPDVSDMKQKAEAQILGLLLTAEYYGDEYKNADVYLPDIGQGSDYSGTMSGAIDYILSLYKAGSYEAAKNLADALNNMPEEGYILVEPIED